MGEEKEGGLAEQLEPHHPMNSPEALEAAERLENKAKDEGWFDDDGDNEAKAA